MGQPWIDKATTSIPKSIWQQKQAFKYKWHIYFPWMYACFWNGARAPYERITTVYRSISRVKAMTRGTEAIAFVASVKFQARLSSHRWGGKFNLISTVVYWARINRVDRGPRRSIALEFPGLCVRAGIICNVYNSSCGRYRVTCVYNMKEAYTIGLPPWL